MRVLSGLTFLAFWIFAAVAPLTAQAATTKEDVFDHPLMEKNFQVPDLSTEYTRVKQRVDDIARKYQLMKSGQDDADLDTRLGDLFSTDNPDRFQSEYSRELNVYNKDYSLDAWMNLGRYYFNVYDLTNAKGVFYHIQKTTRSKRDKASALSYLAEVYMADGDNKTALNLFYLSLQIHSTSNTKYRFQQLAESTDMLLTDVSVNAENDVPSACAIFSQEFRAGFDPEGYIEVSPEVDADIYAQKDRICVRGLKHGAGYTFKIKKGVPSVGGPLLRRDVERTFKVPNMSERLVFSSGAYVLPRSEDALVPLRTVNLSEAKLVLMRVNDRNMVNAMLTNTLDRNLSRGEMNDLQYTIGEKVWEGSVDVDMKLNREVVTNLPLNEMIKDHGPGVYALVAEKKDDENQRYWYERPTQWVLISDFGMTSYQGADGMTAIVRSLETTRPLAGVELALIARNNKVLARTRTNVHGEAKFDPGLLRGEGGNAPALLTAIRKDDYNYISLTGPALDLSEHKVSGRTLYTEMDAYLYAERGVYRPGETVHMSALVRDPASKAVGALPVTFVVSKPDGSEHSKVSVTGDTYGGYQFDIPISAAARSGRWSVRAVLDDDNQAIGWGSFQVEDFVPQRIRAKLLVDKTFAEPGETFDATVQSDFLYGAPAANLSGEMTITVNRDPKPFKDYESYSFGLVQDEFYQQQINQLSFETDKEGKAPLKVDLNKLPKSSLPLRLEMLASVYDVSGRPVYAGWAVPLRSRAVEVGLRRDKEASFDENGDSAFEVIALDKMGKPVAGRDLTYEWFREEYDYTWYQQGGTWRTKTTVFDESLEQGELKTDDKGKTRFARALGTGRYRVEVRDKEGTSIASQRFFIGWWSSGNNPNAPDQLELTVDTDDLTSGDKVSAFVKAPFAGTAYVAVLGDGVLWTKSFDLPAEGRTFEIKPQKDWAPGAYLTVTAYRPDLAAPSRLPVRAMGFKWLTVDRAAHEARVDFEVPDTVVPRQSVTLPFTVAGLKGQRQKMRLTIAAVDEGILQLTDYQSPNPGNHYLSQRALSFTLRDLYGQLIKPMEGARGNLRTGGDKMMRAMSAPEADMAAEENAQGNSTRVVKTVALYHKEIEVGADGKGTVTLDLPDFNGRLRLMAVAYGDTVVGQGDEDLIVRDPVVADVLLPRFLAPGDEALASLTLHNLTDEEKLLKWSVTSSAGVAVLDRANGQIKLKAKEHTEVTLPMSASELGDAKVSLRVSAEGLSDIDRSWDISVRAAQPYVTERDMVKLQPGETAGKVEGLDSFLPDTLRGTFTLATRPEFDVPGLLDALNRYPYGCTEQTVSRALPLLYLGDVAAEYGEDFDSLSLHRRVDRAIARVLAHQTYEGSFAVWDSNGDPYPWLSAYTVDFLTRAQEKGFDVSEAGFGHAVKYLKDFVAGSGGPDYAKSYAFYVLARIGEVRASDVRYYAENDGAKQRTRLGYGQLAATLAILGEKKMAEDFFVKAIKARRPVIWNKIYDYGSDMRDAAALAALISETMPDANRVLELAESIEEYTFNRQYMSTQEQAWLLLATNAIASAPGAQMTVEVDGETWGPRPDAARWTLASAAKIGDMSVTNKGASPVRFIEALRGVPAQPLPAEAKGFEIERTYFDVNGQIVDPAKAKQHDLMVVLIEGRVTTEAEHQALIVDMLPAGFEIENAALGGATNGAGDTGKFRFLPRLTYTQYKDARDDRYVAAINTYGKQGFAVAYLVRAVTPGTYQHPAPFIEDMYHPDYFARGELTEVTITK